MGKLFAVLNTTPLELLDTSSLSLILRNVCFPNQNFLEDKGKHLTSRLAAWVIQLFPILR